MLFQGVRRRQGGCSSWLELERRCRLVNMLHDEVMYEALNKAAFLQLTFF
jgi:hypothetical protein